MSGRVGVQCSHRRGVLLSGPARLAIGFQSEGSVCASGPRCSASNAAVDRHSMRSAIARSSFCRRLGRSDELPLLNRQQGHAYYSNQYAIAFIQSRRYFKEAMIRQRGPGFFRQAKKPLLSLNFNPGITPRPIIQKSQPGLFVAPNTAIPSLTFN